TRNLAEIVVQPVRKNVREDRCENDEVECCRLEREAQGFRTERARRIVVLAVQVEMAEVKMRVRPGDVVAAPPDKVEHDVEPFVDAGRLQIIDQRRCETAKTRSHVEQAMARRQSALRKQTLERFAEPDKLALTSRSVCEVSP